MEGGGGVQKSFSRIEPSHVLMIENKYTHDKLGTNRISLALFARFAHISPLGHVFGVLFVRLTHGRCHRHFESEIKFIKNL